MLTQQSLDYRRTSLAPTLTLAKVSPSEERGALPVRAVSAKALLPWDLFLRLPVFKANTRFSTDSSELVSMKKFQEVPEDRLLPGYVLIQLMCM